MPQLNALKSSRTTYKNDKDDHRVLLVDDDPAILFAYRKLLEKEGITLDIGTSLEDATHLLHAKEYFAVISDLRFSGSDNRDGLHILEIVGSTQPNAKVIMVTGYGSEELQKTTVELGVYHYFEKPVNPSLITDMLKALHIAIHNQINESHALKLQGALCDAPH